MMLQPQIDNFILTFLLILSLVFVSKFVAQFVIKLILNDDTPINLTKTEIVFMYLAISYILTYIII